MKVTIIKSSHITHKDLEIAKNYFFDFWPASIMDQSQGILGQLDITTMAEFDEISDAWKCNVKYDSKTETAYLSAPQTQEVG